MTFKTPKHLLKFMIGIVLFQLGFLLYPIVDQEITSYWGEPLRFKVVLRDPYDVFRGPFIQIQADSSVPFEGMKDHFEVSDPVYAVLLRDVHGFSSFKGVQKNRPDTPYYLKTVVTGISATSYREENRFSALSDHGKKGRGVIFVDFPFSKVSVDLDKSVVVDSRLRNSWVTGPSPYITVKILRGKGVIQDLYLYGEMNGKSDYHSTAEWVTYLKSS